MPPPVEHPVPAVSSAGTPSNNKCRGNETPHCVGATQSSVSASYDNNDGNFPRRTFSSDDNDRTSNWSALYYSNVPDYETGAGQGTHGG